MHLPHDSIDVPQFIDVYGDTILYSGRPLNLTDFIFIARPGARLIFSAPTITLQLSKVSEMNRVCADHL